MGVYTVKALDSVAGPPFLVTLPDSQFGTNAQGKLTLAEAGVTAPTATERKFPVHRSQSVLRQGQLTRIHFTIRPGTFNGADFVPSGTRIQRKSFIVANDPDVIAALKLKYKAAFGIGRIIKISLVTGRRKSDA